ncbi:hypothetical protein Emag_000337 [Eimeria magna]
MAPTWRDESTREGSRVVDKAEKTMIGRLSLEKQRGWCVSKLGFTGCNDETRSSEGLSYLGKFNNGHAVDAWGELSHRSEIGSAGVPGKALLQPEANGFARGVKQQSLLGAQGPGADLRDEVKAASQHPFQTNMASTPFHEMTLSFSTPMQTARSSNLKAIEAGGPGRVFPYESAGTATPVSVTSLNAAFSGVWGAAVRADCVSNPQGILQEILFSHGQSVLSAIELHALRHVLQLERTGPLEDEAAQLVQVLANPLSAEPLSASEHKCLVGLLKRRGATALPAAKNHRLKSLLVRAIASSLSPEQKDCAKAAWLGAAHVAPMSPSGISRLAAFLNGEGWEGTDVQAAIEEQLKPLCTLPQQQAIHRLLFLEEPWSLSLEERKLLEFLQMQLPALSLDQGSGDSTRTEQPQREDIADSNVREALHALLQLLGATLTSNQRMHLLALLHITGTSPGHTQEKGQLSGEEEEQQSAIKLLSARLVTLVCRFLNAQPLTPAECRELQERILRALEELVPGEQLRALQRVIDLDDRAPGSEEHLRALEDMQLALTTKQISSACLDQLDRSGLRVTLLHCLGRTLSSEQLSILTRVLGKWKHEGHQDRQAQPPKSLPSALDASSASGGCNWRDGLAEPAHIASRREEATELLGCACDVLGRLNDVFGADAPRTAQPSHVQPAMTQEFSRLKEFNKARSPGVDDAADGRLASASFNFGMQAAKTQRELVPPQLDELVLASRDREGTLSLSEVPNSLLDDDRGVVHAKPTGEPAEKHALEDPTGGQRAVDCISPGRPASLDPYKEYVEGRRLVATKCASVACCAFEYSGIRGLGRKRALLQRLVHEVVERKIFLDDLKIWRQQFKQRQELHQILKRGYLKRCPCLYHQQQDRLEEEQRRANLELLDSLKCSSFMRREQTVEDIADDVAWSMSLEEASLSAEYPGAQEHAQQQDTAETVPPFESGSFGSSLQPLSRQEDEALLASRGRSMPLSARLGGSAAYRLQGGTASLSGASSSRENFGVARSIAHTRSLGATLHHRPGAGRSRSAPLSLPQPRGIPMGGPSQSQLEFSFERSLRSSCVLAPAGKSSGDKSVAVEEDRNSMQKRALEKAQQLAQDAKVALWIFLKKQVQPADLALGPKLVDMINLQHLSARMLPPGKGWQTRSLLRMVEGLVGLVCSLRGEDAGGSVDGDRD